MRYSNWVLVLIIMMAAYTLMQIPIGDKYLILLGTGGTLFWHIFLKIWDLKIWNRVPLPLRAPLCFLNLGSELAKHFSATYGPRCDCIGPSIVQTINH